MNTLTWIFAIALVFISIAAISQGLLLEVIVGLSIPLVLWGIAEWLP